MKKICLKNILAAILLSTTVTNGAWAYTTLNNDMAQPKQDNKHYEPLSTTFSKWVTLDQNSFILRSNIQVPQQVTLQKVLAEKIFGDKTLLLKPALQGFLDKAKKSNSELPKKLCGNNFISLGSRSQQRYECARHTFYSHLYYVTYTISKPWKNGGTGLPKETYGHVTFDDKQDKVLAVADILNKDAINSMGLAPESTDIEITQSGKLICYTTADTFKEIEIKQENKSLLSDYFKTILDDKAREEKAKMEAEGDSILRPRVVSKENEDRREKPLELEVVDVMPSFPGGDAELFKWLSKNVKYPAIAEENGVQGRVIVKFAVDKDGSIYDPKVLRSVDPSLDREALRVIRSMPRWIPAKKNGHPVSVYFTLPVTFQLQ